MGAKSHSSNRLSLNAEFAGRLVAVSMAYEFGLQVFNRLSLALSLAVLGLMVEVATLSRGFNNTYPNHEIPKVFAGITFGRITRQQLI